ncbi:hypothetical protein C3E77_10070 [Mycetocola zhujimingii]|nr:hypothetical protein C3E77_10070 [Mycetocola zhujimingii]
MPMTAKKELDAAWGERIKEYGFRKYRGRDALPIGEDWFGWLGLNTGTRNNAGAVDVLPIVGVHWKPLAQAYQELNPQLPKSMSPTVSQPLYKLVEGPRNRAEWRVREGSGEPFQLDQLLDATVHWGIPFMESLCHPEVVADLLRPPSKFNPNPAVPWKTYPLALVLTGRRSEALDFVRKHALEVVDKPDMASKTYLEYADRFAERYS